MELRVSLFFILFTLAISVSFLCLYTFRSTLKRSLAVSMLLLLPQTVLLSLVYSFMPAGSPMTIVMPSLLFFLGWLYMCRISSEKSNLLFFFVLFCWTYVLLCNTVWLVLIGIAVNAGFYNEAVDVLLLVIPLAVFLPPFCRLFRRTWSDTRDLKDLPWFRMSLIPATFLIVYLAVYVLRYYGYVDTIAEHIIMITLSVCALTTCYQIVFALARSAQAARYAENLESVQHIVDIQKIRMEEMMSHNEEVGRLKHDLRQHMISIKGLLDEKKYSRAGQYVSQFESQAGEIMREPLCGNDIVNTLATYYVEEAKTAGVCVHADISLPNAPGVADTDLCVLVGNLFENAIEACGYVERDRSIEFTVRSKAGRILISMKNSFDGTVRLNGNGDFLSRKREGTGMGLSSIRAIAQKYDGRARFVNKGDVFLSEILLYASRNVDS